MTSLCWSHLVTFSFAPCVTVDQITFWWIRRPKIFFASVLIVWFRQLILLLAPLQQASTTTASTAAPAIAASTSTTASSFHSNSAPSAVSTARAEHAGIEDSIARHSLVAKQPRSCLIYKATSLLTKEGLLTVSSRTTSQIKAMTATTWSLMNNHPKQSTDLRVNIYICSSRTNKLEGQKTMKLMQET